MTDQNALFDLPPGARPYLEVLDMREDDDGYYVSYFSCGACGRVVDAAPCPDHAPLNVPGLQLVECDADPRHPRVWTVCSEAYPPPCMYCVYAAVSEAHDGCRHSHHGRWRRWRITRRAAGWAYVLGVVSGYSLKNGGGCDGCLNGIHRRGKRPYLLGWPRWKWNCLLSGRHWPGQFVGMDSCAKCLPCPDCGSSTSCFDGPCDNQSAEVAR